MAPTQTLAPTLPIETPVGHGAKTWSSYAIPIEKLLDDGSNPRKDYGEQDGTFAALVQSIRERGMLQPPVVRPLSDDEECSYHIVVGHRRIAAAKALGWSEVTCVPMQADMGPQDDSYTEVDKLVDALAENLQRKDLNCIEVAEGIGRLEAFGRTQEQIARLIGRSQGRVSRCVRLLELPYGVRALLREGALYQSVAEEMLPLVGSGLLPGEIDAMAYKAIESKLTAEGMATLVRHTVARLQSQQAVLFGANNSDDGEPVEDEVDARIARTLASTKGLDKEPAPKDTNSLTRSESDSQFKEAMAPDPDVQKLSSLPAAHLPAAESAALSTPASSPTMHVVVSGLGAEALLALAESEPYKGHDLADIVGAILVRRAVELELIPNPAEVPQEPAESAVPEPAVQSFRVSYCYPQLGAWQGGGACEIEDGVPAVFDSLFLARKFAREDSLRNPRFLIHVIAETEYPNRQYDKCQERGDCWFFGGKGVPGGISNSVPSPEHLALVGCVLEDLCKEGADAS